MDHIFCENVSLGNSKWWKRFMIKWFRLQEWQRLFVIYFILFCYSEWRSEWVNVISYWTGKCVWDYTQILIEWSVFRIPPISEFIIICKQITKQTYLEIQNFSMIFNVQRGSYNFYNIWTHAITKKNFFWRLTQSLYYICLREKIGNKMLFSNVKSFYFFLLFQFNFESFLNLR